MTYVPLVRSNCITQMRVILEAAASLKIELHSPEALEAAQTLLALPPHGSPWGPDIASSVRMLWNDRGIKETFALGNKKYQLNETAGYFFDEIERFIPDDYIPTIDDVLRVRVRSTGIEEAMFTFDDVNFLVVDVGGQRSERRKWIHCFDNVTAVLFCASLSSYDQVLREDRTQNRLIEAILLFDEVANSTCFQKNDIILFLNKLDLFEAKIDKVDLNVCFAGYTGGSNLELAKDFISKRFTETTNSRVYTHYTTAIDTKNIEFVIKSVRETLLTATLADMGLYNKQV